MKQFKGVGAAPPTCGRLTSSQSLEGVILVKSLWGGVALSGH